MNQIVRWTAAAALAIVAVLALGAALDPQHESAIIIFPDEAEHAGIAFLILTLGAAVIPRAPIWLLAVPLLAAGTGLELLQAAGLVPGMFELRDFGADILGVGAAAFSLACAELRQTSRRQRPTEDRGS